MFGQDSSTTQNAPKNGVGLRIATIVTIVVAVLAFGGGWLLAGDKQQLAPLLPAFVGGVLVNDREPSDVDLSPVWKAWRILNERFVPAALGTTSAATSTDQDRVWGMIEGLAASMGDPYTVFMPPAQASEFQEDISGVFEGVGMEIDVKDGILIVVTPLKNSPAEKAGIEAKDVILSIDGVSTQGIDVAAAVKKIRGPHGTSVTLSVVHDGEVTPHDITITRDVITAPIVETKKLSGGVFVISIYTFTSNSASLFSDAIHEFEQSGDTKLIIDLRGNPGGYLEAAVDMASWFLPSGKVIVTEDYGDRQPNVPHRSRGYDTVKDNVKVAILVNKGSASASEIFAGALKEYKRATLVGTETFGKGSVQELIPITSDTSLKVTVARWLLPNDVWIPHTGIVPDITADRTLDDVKSGKDPQMDRAVEFLRTGK